MNQNPETHSQSNPAGQQVEIERELRLAKAYWLETIWPHIEGRILRGVEFFVAQEAHWRLQAAKKKAEDWNSRCVAVAGKPFPPPEWVSADVDFSAEKFREPEMPEMLFADNVKPEVLATVAAQLVNNGKKRMTLAEALRNAHELLMAAERYIGRLPTKKGGINTFISGELAFSYVTFAEIFDSNKKDSGQLPLLPPLQTKRKGRGEKEISNEPLSLKQIKDEVKRLLRNRPPRLTLNEYEQEAEVHEELVLDYDQWQQREQEMVERWLKDNRISVQDLCALRWERFRQFAQKQQGRAVTRAAHKTAVANPPPAGKRKQ